MIVALSVRPHRESEFNAFYQHEFLPTVLEVVPEFKSVVRYEEIAGSASDAADKRSVTIYQIASDEVAEAAIMGFARPSLQTIVKQFQDWKPDFGTFTRVHFNKIHEHNRRQLPTFTGNGLYLQTVEVKSEFNTGFWGWYHNQYLVRLMADVPGWNSATTCQSVNTEPTRQMIFFEANDVTATHENMSQMRAPHRAKENVAWEEWSKRALDHSEHGLYRRTFAL